MAVPVNSRGDRVFFTIADLMKRWEVSRSTIEREIRRGRLVPYRVGCLVRFRLDEIDRYETSRW